MWTLPLKVRDVMGLDEDATADDREIEVLIRIAQEHIKDDLFTYHYDETVNGNPDTGASWDGSNTTFQTSSYPIMDSNYDFTVNSSDVLARWINSSYSPASARVSVSSATYGILSITQDGSTAIPSDAETVKVDYYSCHRSISRLHLEDLTTYLAAHLVQQRLKTGTSISAADLEKNRPLIIKGETIYLDMYRTLLSKLQDRTFKGA